MGKKSFILYSDQKEVIDELDDVQAGQLLKALYEYNSSGDIILTGALKLIFIPFKTAFDRDGKKWQNTSEKRREAGKKGMEKRWGKDEAKITNDNKNNKNNKQYQNVTTITDTVTVTGTVTVTDNNNKAISHSSNDFDRFEQLWNLYPRKQGKAGALKKYKKICGKIDDDVIKRGIIAYTEYINNKQIDKQFVKMGSTWFNGECWNDEYVNEQKKQPEWFEKQNEIEKASEQEVEEINELLDEFR